MSLQRILLSAIALCAVMFTVGCESMGSKSAMATPPQHAVVISGGQHGGTAVFLQTNDPMNPTVLADKDMPMCPTCKAAAIKYFQTGVLEPHCPDCGATRTATTFVQPMIGHQ